MAIALTSSVALAQVQQTTAIVTCVIHGINTGVNIVDKVATYAGDYEDFRIDVGVLSYWYDTTMTHTLPGVTYRHVWYVFQDYSGTFRYSYTFSQNGTLLFGPAYEPFEVGTPGGLPLTKRQWSCVQNGPTLWYSAASTSYLYFRAVHTVTKPSQYWWKSPTSYETILGFGGTSVAATCGVSSGPWGSWSTTQSIPRNLSRDFEFNGLNIVIEDISAYVKK